MEKWFRRSFYLFASLLWLVGSVAGQGIPTAAPAEVGLSAERLTRIDRVLEDAIDRKQIAGAVALISRRGKVAYFNRFGMLDIEAGKLMRRDAIFRIASMTKAITSVGVMMLAEEGRFLLNDPVSRYLPEFKDMKVLVPAAEGAPADPPYELVSAKGEITIRKLLTHTSGITYRFFGLEHFTDLYKESAFSSDLSIMRVLVAEDESPLAAFLRKGLEQEHYAVDVAPDGDEAHYMAIEYDYDLVILDLNLPRVHGLEVLKRVREKKASLPVLILTSRNQVEDRVQGLDLGADDYLTKPFSYAELSARIRALLRRGTRAVGSVLRVDDLEINRVERIVKRAGKKIDLTPKEFALLEYLMRNAGRRVTRAMIIEHVWNLSFDTMTNVVDVYINYLRRKIDEGFGSKLIQTVRGVGYQLGTSEESGE